MSTRLRERKFIAAALLIFGGIASVASAADAANGKLDFKGRSATFRHAWLVTGPSDLEPGKTVRRIVLSSADIGATLQACKTFSCTDGEVMDGATIDFTGGPRLNYWIAMNGQKIQYSGTAKPATFTARTDDPKHLAGRIAIDDVAAGGPKLDAEFDVTLLKEFRSAR